MQNVVIWVLYFLAYHSLGFTSILNEALSKREEKMLYILKFMCLLLLTAEEQDRHDWGLM